MSADATHQAPLVSITSLAAERGFAMAMQLSPELWKQEIAPAANVDEQQSWLRSLIQFTGCFLGARRREPELSATYQVFRDDGSLLDLKLVASLDAAEQPTLTLMLPDEACAAPPENLQHQAQCCAALRREGQREEVLRQQAWQQRLKRLQAESQIADTNSDLPEIKERARAMAQQLKTATRDSEPEQPSVPISDQTRRRRPT